MPYSRFSAWVVGVAVVLSLLVHTARAQDTYVWTGDAGLNWNTNDANWQIDGEGAHVAWIDGNIARFTDAGEGAVTLTQDIVAHGLVFTAGRHFNASGGFLKLHIDSGGIDGPGQELYFDTVGNQFQVVVTADQTWHTYGSNIRFAAQNTTSAIATATDGLVLTITSTGGQGGLRNFGHFSLADFNGTIRAHSGWVMLVTRLWYADNVLFDMMDNNTASAWTANSVSPQPIRGLINGGASGRANFYSNDQVEFVGVGTYSFAARLGPANRVLKSGPGTQIFTGALDHTGDTTITNGTLRINGTHVNATNYTVQAGGTLGGTGTITFVESALLTIEADGMLDPGADADAVGTLTLAGDVTLEEGAVYHWDFAGGDGDRVDVAGTLTLPMEATLDVNLISGELPRESTLMTFASHSGATTLSGWEVVGAGGKETVALDLEGNRVLLQVPPKGLMMIMR